MTDDLPVHLVRRAGDKRSLCGVKGPPTPYGLATNPTRAGRPACDQCVAVAADLGLVPAAPPAARPRRR